LLKPIDTVKLHDVLFKWIPAGKWEDAKAGDPRKGQDPEYSIAIKGVNVSRGIATTGGTIEKYLKTLAIFCADSIEKIREIKSCLETANLRLFTIHVHALKSASANIGAESVSEEARVLEEAGKEGDAALVRSRSPHFLADLDELLRNIDSFLAMTNECEQGATVDMGLLREELSRLKEAIVSFDSRSMRTRADVIRKFSHAAGVGATIDGILHNLLIGDYDRAVSLVDSILDEQ